MGELGELGAQTARFRFVALAVRAAQATLSLVGLVVLARLLATPLLPQSIGASRLAPALAVYAAGFLLAWFVVPGGLAAARSLGGIFREVELESDGRAEVRLPRSP